jgi:hypothetical protein
MSVQVKHKAIFIAIIEIIPSFRFWDHFYPNLP